MHYVFFSEISKRGWVCARKPARINQDFLQIFCEESQKIALRAGMDDYLVKPLRLEKIYETVARYVKTDGEKPD